MRVEESFTLRFTGEAVEEHSMDVRLLAPALISAANMMTTAHDVLRPTDPAPKIEIRATAPGSFVVDLLATASGGFTTTIIDYLSGREANATANSLAYIGAALGAMTFIVKKRGRKIQKETLEEENQVRIIFTDETVVIVPQEAKTLANNQDFRTHARELASSVENEGLDSLEISSDLADTILLKPGDVSAFSEQILDFDAEEREGIFQIKSLTLEGNYRWRLSEGAGRTFTAPLQDKDFQQRITLGTERFGKGDLLRARVLETKHLDEDGKLHTDTVIIKVLEHIVAGEQDRLDLENPET